MISVLNALEVYWGKDLVSHDELALGLSGAAQQDPQPEIQIQGANDMDYQSVVKVMSAIQNAGLVKLDFVSNPGWL